MTVPVSSFRVTKAQSEVFAPVGRCIYCPDISGVGLGREHIVPFGMGGGLILPEASCKKCGAVTESFETTCQRKMFIRHRLAQGLVRHSREMADRIRELSEQPDYLILPLIQGMPGMITGHAPTTPFHGPFRFYAIKEEWPGNKPDARTEALVRAFDMSAFMRLLAKIAHSFSVAQLGIDGFDPELLELIQGHAPHSGAWFVGASTEVIPPPEQSLHQVGMTFMAWGNRWLVIVRIRLWAAHDTPSYHVISGLLIETPERLARFGLQPLAPQTGAA
jgi:hypothetical protein